MKFPSTGIPHTPLKLFSKALDIAPCPHKCEAASIPDDVSKKLFPLKSSAL